MSAVLRASRINHPRATPASSVLLFVTFLLFGVWIDSTTEIDSNPQASAFSFSTACPVLQVRAARIGGTLFSQGAGAFYWEMGNLMNSRTQTTMAAQHRNRSCDLKRRPKVPKTSGFFRSNQERSSAIETEVSHLGALSKILGSSGVAHMDIEIEDVIRTRIEHKTLKKDLPHVQYLA